jgi:Tfp pilus assembly protein PilF
MYLKEAIKYDPNYTGAYYILSTLARKKGDRTLAARYLVQFKKCSDQEKKDGSSAILSARHR